MAALRILTISIFAAVSSCIIASLVLFGRIDRFSFVALPFALVGAIVVLPMAFGALREYGRSVRVSYLGMLAIGAVMGGLMVGIPSIGRLDGVAIGGFYGLTTALCWVVLHAIAAKWRQRRNCFGLASSLRKRNG